ncbi:solute carrier family 35 member C2-like isoform X1 [Hydractinia symbiolongicarpus]|uniref:solute carrier family 35 member C2-like isoform X1 n=1 Tax=Hydractinia symbiolongicarpus TaxID=13093 RepID=UPI0025502F14|nr:solute carrier family 35 member C2-like isoform X1 [Hydractinia symbiolongicarpus]
MTIKWKVNAASFVRSAFLIIFVYATSISLTFYNKWMSKKYRFPLTVSTVHFVVVFLLSALGRRLLELYYKEHRIVLGWGMYFRKVFPTAVSASLDIGLSNWSIMLSTISLYTMAKSSTILFILLFSILFGLEKINCSLVIVVLLIATGLFLFTYESKQFNMVGFIMAILASVMAGVRWTTAQLVMQKKSIGLTNPLDAIFHIQPIMALTMVVLAFSMEGTAVASSDLLFRAPSYDVAISSLFIVLIGAVLAFLLTLSEFLLVCNTSSLTLSIAGIFKEVCTLTIATELGGDKWTVTNFIGLVICMTGISVHVVGNALKESTSKPENSNDGEKLAMKSLLQDDNSDSDDVLFESVAKPRRFQHGD